MNCDFSFDYVCFGLSVCKYVAFIVHLSFQYSGLKMALKEQLVIHL